MSLWQRLKEGLQNVQDNLDLKKRFPNYFYKPIFVGIIIFMVLFTAVIFLNEGKTRWVYAECPNDSVQKCNNPFYVCPKNTAYVIKDNISFNISLVNPELNNCVHKEVMPKEVLSICETGVCERKYLEIGEVVGDKPNHWVLNYNIYCLLIVALGFLINHIAYLVRSKRK